MNAKKTVLRFLIIQSAIGLSDYVLINLTGTQETLEDGSKVLHFNCSSSKPLKVPYVEFLINNKSIASFTLKNGKCNVLQNEYNCEHICKCSFDNLTTHWTFPVPTNSKTQTVYSCQMLIVSKTKYEQAHIRYNGTDFLKPTKDKDMVFKIKNGTTTTDDPKTELDKVQIQPNLTALYLIIGVILGMVFSIIFNAYKKRKKDRRKTMSDRKSKEDIEQVLHQTDIGKERGIKMFQENEEEVKGQLDIGQERGIEMFEENAEEVKGQLETDLLLEEPEVSILHQSEIGKARGNKMFQENAEEVKGQLDIGQDRGIEMFEENAKEVKGQLGTLNDKVGMNYNNVENPLCRICMKLNRTRKAAAMCICCEEATCLSCRYTHKFMKQSRDHNFVNIEKVPPYFNVPMTCKKHQHKIEYFCTYHQCLCCRTCLSQDCLERCTCDTIDDLSKNFMSSQIFKDHSEMVHTYSKISSSLNLYLYQNIDSRNHTMQMFTKKN